MNINLINKYKYICIKYDNTIISEYNMLNTLKKIKYIDTNIINNYESIINKQYKNIKKNNNKGIGAGGKNTTLNGNIFENKTSIENILISNNYVKKLLNNNKYGYYLEYNLPPKKIIYLTQSGLKTYIKNTFNINIYRHPDEAFLIIQNNKYYLKILEKKNQNVDGSVEDKLKTGLFNKKEYEKMLNQNQNIIFNIEYAFCLSKFLQNKFESNQIKYQTMKQLILDDNIKIFYGDDNDYIDKLYLWINQISES